jgi:hypothetical protein
MGTVLQLANRAGVRLRDMLCSTSWAQRRTEKPRCLTAPPARIFPE